MHKRSHVIVILISLICFHYAAFAQTFVPGYYVKTSGDTVKTNVFIKRKGSYVIGLLTKSGQSFSRADIIAMGANTTSYVLRNITVDKSPKGPVTNDTTFMEVLSRGKIGLLTMTDENYKDHFYIEDEDGSITELVLKVLDRGDGITFQELQVYKQTLRQLFPACNQLFPIIERTRYTRSSIRSIYEKLYECRYGNVPEMTSNKEIVTDAGLILGVSSTNLSFKQYSGFAAIAPQLTFDNSTDLTGGVFIESRFTKNASLLTLRNELTHRRYKTSSSDFYGGQGQTHLFGSVSADYIKYSLVLRATFSHNNLKPFVNIGGSPALLVATSNRALTISPGTQHTESLLGKVKRVELGFFAGVGLRFNNVAIEARFERSNGLQPEYCDSSVRTLYITLSYRLLAGNY